jgi:glycosyltransferase involved in cell wall biosynthesis
MKVLVVYKHENRSFILNDIEALKKHFDVTSFHFKFSRILSLRHELKKCDIVFIWFCSYHAFITALLTKKPIVVVTGGYDVAGEKALKYGLMLNPVYKRMVRYVLMKAKKILAVSEFNDKEIQRHLGITEAQVSYNSIDCNKFFPKGEKEDVVLTVGYVKEETWVRKGIVRFVELAVFSEKLKPEPMQFIAVGKISDELREKVERMQRDTPNLLFTGYASDEELLKLYQKAKVYCQLSAYESFGVSLAEAMACECVPVVTGIDAFSEVVGDTGFYVKDNDVANLQDLVKEALKSDKGKQARERIMKLYPPEKREAELVEAVESCCVQC